ncbi:MAG: MFS transporter [Novosphingobium sp.]|nr:MFS transporter [Novosphingobium sp.]
MQTATAIPAAGSRRSLLWLLFPLMVAEVVGSLELTMIYAAMRALIADFGSASAAGWLVTSYMLSSAAGAALFGRVGDLLGRRRILLLVLALAAIGSLVSAVMEDFEWVVAGRAMQGAAGSIIPLCFGIARERVNPAQLPFAIGLLAAASSVASATGLVFGGIIIDFFDWPMIFKVTTVLGALAFLCVMLMVAPDRQWNPAIMREDLLGGLLFVPAAVGLLLAIDNAGHVGLTDSMTLVYGAIALLSLGAWLWRELSIPNPLIQVRLLATRDIGMGNAIFVALALGAFQGGHIMALFGQQDPVTTGAGLGLSATAAGMLLLPANLITAACYPMVAKLCDTIGPRFTATVGFLMVVAGFGSLIFWNDNVPLVMALLVIQSVGLGVVYVTIPMVIVSASPADRVSESTGMMTVIRATAMAIGAQTVATLLSAKHAPGAASTFPGESDYITVFLFVCATALAGAILSRFLPSRLATRTD